MANPVVPTKKSLDFSAILPFEAINARVFLTTLYSAPSVFKMPLRDDISDTVSPLKSVNTIALARENFSVRSDTWRDFFSLVTRSLLLSQRQDLQHKKNCREQITSFVSAGGLYL